MLKIFYDNLTSTQASARQAIATPWAWAVAITGMVLILMNASPDLMAQSVLFLGLAYYCFLSISIEAAMNFVDCGKNPPPLVSIIPDLKNSIVSNIFPTPTPPPRQLA